MTFLDIKANNIADKYNLCSIGSDIMLEVFLKLKDIPNDVASSDAFKTLPFKLIRVIILNMPGKKNGGLA